MSLNWLLERMAEWHDVPAIVWRDQQTSYDELLGLIAFWSDRLRQDRVRAGEVVAIEGEYSPSACALLLSLIHRGAIIVPITKVVEAHREEFLQTAEVERVISFDEGDGYLVERREGIPRDGHHQLIQRLVEANAPGLILFSSGSTGKSKAALHDFHRLLEKYKIPRQRMTVLTFLLFDHIGGINTLLYTLSTGGTVVSTENRDAEEVCRLIERNRVELLPASPTFLNLLLLSGAYNHHDMSSLKLITYGTEVMPEHTLRRLREAFPQLRLQQTYGLTELGILRSKSKDSQSLWVKVGGEGVETKVIDGILWIRTRSAMLGYLNAPSPFDGSGWMNTHDAVEVDGEYVRFLGRKSEIINVGGNKVSPAEVESVLMQMTNIRDVTVYGEPNPITGQMVVTRVNLVEPEDQRELSKRMRAFCRDKLVRFKIPVKVEIAGQALFSARYKKIRQPT